MNIGPRWSVSKPFCWIYFILNVLLHLKTYYIDKDRYDFPLIIVKRHAGKTGEAELIGKSICLDFACLYSTSSLSNTDITLLTVIVILKSIYLGNYQIMISTVVWALREVIKIQHKQMGGMGVAIHYEELCKLHDGVSLIMAYGLPVSRMSLAIQIAMSITGKNKSIAGNSHYYFTLFFPAICMIPNLI